LSSQSTLQQCRLIDGEGIAYGNQPKLGPIVDVKIETENMLIDFFQKKSSHDIMNAALLSSSLGHSNSEHTNYDITGYINLDASLVHECIAIYSIKFLQNSLILIDEIGYN